MAVSNKQSAQLAELKRIEESYSHGTSAEELSKSYEGGDVIPVYTPEQFAKVGTGETGYVAETGKIYTYTTDKTYMFYGQKEDITEVINKIVEDKVKEVSSTNTIEKIYPVGSIYITTNETNPEEYLGGKWESYGQGRTLIGAGEGTDTNGTRQTFLAGNTGGEYTHTLSVAEMPSHTHKPVCEFGAEPLEGVNTDPMLHERYNPEGERAMYLQIAGLLAETSASSGAKETTETGGSIPHNNTQPYITCYMWKRVQ